MYLPYVSIVLNGSSVHQGKPRPDNDNLRAMVCIYFSRWTEGEGGKMKRYSARPFLQAARQAPMQTLSQEHLDILCNKNARCFSTRWRWKNDEYELSLSTGTQHRLRSAPDRRVLGSPRTRVGASSGSRTADVPGTDRYSGSAHCALSRRLTEPSIGGRNLSA